MNIVEIAKQAGILSEDGKVLITPDGKFGNGCLETLIEMVRAEDEAKLDMMQNNLDGIEFVYDKAKAHIEVLEADINNYQAKLAIAVETLEVLNYGTGTAKEALNKIKGE